MTERGRKGPKQWRLILALCYKLQLRFLFLWKIYFLLRRKEKKEYSKYKTNFELKQKSAHKQTCKRRESTETQDTAILNVKVQESKQNNHIWLF